MIPHSHTYFYPFLDPDDLNEVFNLEFLENFDLDKLPDVEKIGEKYIGQIQAAMEELYGDEMMAAMPEDRIQPCLMGVSFLPITHHRFPFQNSSVSN